MKISELPEEIKKRALMYQREETSKSYDKNTDILSDAFYWEHTVERHDHWKKYDEKELPKPDKLQQLIEWMEVEAEIEEEIQKYGTDIYITFKRCINKAKEIKKK